MKGMMIPASSKSVSRMRERDMEVIGWAGQCGGFGIGRMPRHLATKQGLSSPESWRGQATNKAGQPQQKDEFRHPGQPRIDFFFGGQP
jgi:hypothetical protein